MGQTPDGETDEPRLALKLKKLAAEIGNTLKTVIARA